MQRLDLSQVRGGHGPDIVQGMIQKSVMITGFVAMMILAVVYATY